MQHVKSLIIHCNDQPQEEMVDRLRSKFLDSLCLPEIKGRQNEEIRVASAYRKSAARYPWVVIFTGIPVVSSFKEESGAGRAQNNRKFLY